MVKAEPSGYMALSAVIIMGFIMISLSAAASREGYAIRFTQLATERYAQANVLVASCVSRALMEIRQQESLDESSYEFSEGRCCITDVVSAETHLTIQVEGKISGITSSFIAEVQQQESVANEPFTYRITSLRPQKIGF